MNSRKMGGDNSSDTWGGKALSIPGPQKSRTYLVGLRDWKGNVNDHSVLAHECVHCATMILSDRGVDFSGKNDEALSYLTAYLVRKSLNVLLPKKLRVSVDPSDKPKKK